MLELIKKNLNFKSGILIFIIASFFIFLTNNIKKNKPKDISNYVVDVKKGFLSESINSSGEIKAIKTVKISPRKPGFIKTLIVEEGDKVIKDQLLGTLDDKEFKYKLKELKIRNDKQKSDFSRRKYLFSCSLLGVDRHVAHAPIYASKKNLPDSDISIRPHAGSSVLLY